MISADEDNPTTGDDSRKRRNRVAFDTAATKRQKFTGVVASEESQEEEVGDSSGEKIDGTIEESTTTEKISDTGKEAANNEDEYEVEAIVAHKVYRSNAVKYYIKWVGYDSKENTWEPAKVIHKSCPKLCAAYWLQKNITVPINVPLIPHPPQVPAALRRFADRLKENNIDENSIIPTYRNQGFQLAYGRNYPKPDTVWEKELRAIHFIHKITGTDQALAYVSWMNTDKTVHAIQELHERCPELVVLYYEARMTFH
ncbi:hypothetical protein BX666DRAFT_1881535 [Dichotomocladium elegans]|nr:hypothetical protein BX666DRAFT_1881535 [Dichotomocladium elegans]